ncbi:MAG: hypothetical protein Q7T26_06885 [Dehalococcoidia bacterium]|nr:hypothetical protein [Dehalococcoidia bacterium]
MPLVVMLDTHIYDRLAAAHSDLCTLQESVQAGQLILLTTHVQEDELARIPDLEKRERVASILHLCQWIPTSDFVLDFSRLDMARLGTGETVEAIRKGNSKHTKDALIAATAAYEGGILVTEDKVLKKRAQSHGLTVWTYAEMLTRLTTYHGP